MITQCYGPMNLESLLPPAKWVKVPISKEDEEKDQEDYRKYLEKVNRGEAPYFII